MLKVEENRSTLWLTDDESGMQICVCKTRAAWERAFESCNANFCSEWADYPQKLHGQR